MPPSNAVDPLHAPHLWIARGETQALAAAARARVADAKGDWGAHYILAAALRARGEAEAARQELEGAQLLHGLIVLKDAGVDLDQLRLESAYAAGLAHQLYGTGHVALASLAYAAAIQAGCEERQVWLSLGLSMQHQGRAEEAARIFYEVGDRWPIPGMAQFLLPALFGAKDGLARQAMEARRWAVRHTPACPAPLFGNLPAAGRRLRIGYVAPSFSQTQARQFLAPLFDHHDRQAVEVFAYPNVEEDGAAFASPVTMRAIGALADPAAAELIRGDRIDVLIDCWGHNGGSRLPVFALRPAPVQISWLNYQQTTGMDAMDYVLQSDFADCPAMEALFVEEVWRMGDACGAFRPDPGPRSSPAPCLSSGRVTFGAFVHPAKLSDDTVELWAKVLKGAPTFRLVLKYAYFVDPVLQMATRARFLAEGADPAQLEFRGRTTGAAYHGEFADIDLALDPTPYVGGTTSMEALSRGVPVLTLKGPTYYSRLGAAVVAPAGLADLVVESGEDYVAKALGLAADPLALQALRERVPAGFDAAPYRDEAGMARRLETVYRAMYERWSGRAAKAA